MKAQAVSLGALTAIQLVLSFLLQVVVISKVGIGTQTDSWVAAQAVPSFLFAVAWVSFQGAWQARLVVAEDQSTFDKLQREAHGQLFIVLGAVIAILVPTAAWWTRAIFPGLSGDQQALTAEMTGVLLFATLLNAHAALFTISMRARQRFVLPEIVTLIGNALALMFATLFLEKFGVMAAAWGTLLRAAVIDGTLFILSSRILPSLKTALRQSESWRRINPLLMASTVSNSRPLVDRFLGSFAPAGSLTTLNLALVGMNALASVLERAITTVPITRLAVLAQREDHAGIRSTYRSCLRRTGVAAIVLALLLLCLYPIWPTVAKATIHLPSEAATQLWIYTLLLVGILVPAASGNAVVHSFYALSNTTTPAKVGTMGFLISVVVKAIAFYVLGIIGLILAIIAHYTGNLLVLIWLLERRLKQGESI